MEKGVNRDGMMNRERARGTGTKDKKKRYGVQMSPTPKVHSVYVFVRKSGCLHQSVNPSIAALTSIAHSDQIIL